MKTIMTLVVCCISVSLSSQSLLNKPDLQEKIRTGILHMYNCEFKKSEELYQEVEKKLPGSPALIFLRGIQVYWMHFPLTPYKDVEEKQFISAMEKTIDESLEILEKDKNNIEASFFELIARGMLMLYYADIGAESKVIPHARPAYRHVVKAFEYKEQFSEFLFFTGLYNYYIEAYPEYYPFYKPLALLFKNGSKKEGLEELKHACEQTIFVRTEALFFTSIIYMNFEKNPGQALAYARKLHELYPRNPFFLSRYIEMLIENGHYKQAIPHLVKLFDEKDNKFTLMTAFIFKGMIEEKYKMDHAKAERDYQRGLDLTPLFGERSHHYKAMAYAGLSRINKKTNPKLAKSYMKLAKDEATYDYVLD